jgi:hypothetical protein
MKFSEGDLIVFTSGMPYLTSLYGAFEAAQDFDADVELRKFLEQRPELCNNPDYSRFMVYFMYNRLIMPTRHTPFNIGSDNEWWVKPTSLCN